MCSTKLNKKKNKTYTYVHKWNTGTDVEQIKILCVPPNATSKEKGWKGVGTDGTDKS